MINKNLITFSLIVFNIIGMDQSPPAGSSDKPVLTDQRRHFDAQGWKNLCMISYKLIYYCEEQNPNPTTFLKNLDALIDNYNYAIFHTYGDISYYLDQIKALNEIKKLLSQKKYYSARAYFKKRL